MRPCDPRFAAHEHTSPALDLADDRAPACEAGAVARVSWSDTEVVPGHRVGDRRAVLVAGEPLVERHVVERHRSRPTTPRGRTRLPDEAFVAGRTAEHEHEHMFEA